MMNKKMFHHRRASKDQLEAFEAAASAAKFTQKVKKKDHKGWIKGRISLDMQVKNILNLPQHNNSHSVDQKQVVKDIDHNKNLKQQPSSPGGRLANFLNSLFSHSSGSSKKKNKPKSSLQSMEDMEQLHQSPRGRNSKRRISISHSDHTKFIYSSSPPSGFGTPPRDQVQTPTKRYKELLSFSKLNRHIRSAVALQKPGVDEEKRRKDEAGCVEKQKKKKKKNCGEKDRGWVEKMVAEEIELRKIDDIIDNIIDDDDDGGETDSSSDLFELQIYDLDYYSTGLPVYESTDIDTIKRRNSISNGVC